MLAEKKWLKTPRKVWKLCVFMGCFLRGGALAPRRNTVRSTTTKADAVSSVKTDTKWRREAEHERNNNRYFVAADK